MNSKNKGFTLIEVLVVIGIIAILAAIVVVAINPARQFAQANNSQRWSNANSILNAVHQYSVDNRGALPAGITNTPTAVCQTVGTPNCAGLVDLTALTPTYVVDMPSDPTTSTANSTGYFIATSTDNRIVVTAPGQELGVVIRLER